MKTARFYNHLPGHRKLGEQATSEAPRVKDLEPLVPEPKPEKPAPPAAAATKPPRKGQDGSVRIAFAGLLGVVAAVLFLAICAGLAQTTNPPGTINYGGTATTNPPRTVTYAGTSTSTNPPSTNANLYGGSAVQYVSMVVSNGVVIWPTNFTFTLAVTNNTNFYGTFIGRSDGTTNAVGQPPLFSGGSGSAAGLTNIQIPVDRQFASANYGFLTAPVPNAWSIKDRAPVPWLAWNNYFWKVFTLTETDVKSVATMFQTNGLLAAGYNYIWLDSGWSAQTNNADGSLCIDYTRFPDGMSGLANWLHARGFKFGLYVNAGLRNCDTSTTNGSYGHELLHAQQLSSWGVDAVKVDQCNIADVGLTDEQVARIWLNALSFPNVNRPMVFMATQFYTLGYSGCYLNAWQNAQGTPFSASSDSCMGKLAQYIQRATNAQSVDYAPTTSSMSGDIAYVSPGHYRDDGCIAGAMQNCDITNVMNVFAEFVQPVLWNYPPDPTNAMAMTNSEVLAILQDKACIQGKFVTNISNVTIYSRPLSEDGAQAVLLFNTNSTPQSFSLDCSIFGFTTPVTVRDVNAKTNLGTAASSLFAHMNPTCGPISVSVGAYGTTLLRVWRQSATPTPLSGDARLLTNSTAPFGFSTPWQMTKVKTNSASTNNMTVPFLDSELQGIPVLSNKTYSITVHFNTVNDSATNGVKYAVVFPAVQNYSAFYTEIGGYEGGGLTCNKHSPYLGMWTPPFPITNTYTPSTPSFWMDIQYVARMATNGTVNFYWSQAVSGASYNRLGGGSFMRVQQLD
jgi:hypothetical protein